MSQYPTKVALKGKGDNGKTEPEDGGQYGLRLGVFLPEFNDTEIALYHVNYHSRRPLMIRSAYQTFHKLQLPKI
ncbi:DUF1302 family protein [Pseudoalteromonas sp. B193]